MNNDMVLQKLESGLLTITMNRPDRRNALNPDMTRGLVEAARRAAKDHEVRAVLLKGAGGTFCVGGDVKSLAEGPPAPGCRSRWPATCASPPPPSRSPPPSPRSACPATMAAPIS